MYSRWTLPHVRRLFVSIPQRFPQGVQLSQLHQPSRNVNYRKEIGALDSFVGHLIALLVHFLLWQAAKPSGDKCTPFKNLM